MSLTLRCVAVAPIIAVATCTSPPQVAPAASTVPTAGQLLVTVRPARGGSPEVTAVEVREEIHLDGAPGGRPFSVQSPIVYAGRTGIADRVDALTVHDASGDVPLQSHDDPVNRGGFPYYRHWRAARNVASPVVVTYRMKSFTGRATVGPQFDFYSHAGGVSTGGMALFVLPESLGAMVSRVHWDLSDLARGSFAASTYGEGDIELRGPVDRLMQAYYMAGPMGKYAPPRGGVAFHAYWLGLPEFEPSREMAWTYQSYQYLRKFYRDSSASSYTVFVRALPGTGGGTALQNSFMLGVAPGSGDSTKTGPRGTLAHEMGHMFVGGLSGVGNAGGTWFAEGLNEFYTRLLLLRSGLGSVAGYIQSQNGALANYYSNPFRNASSDSLGKVGFASGIGSGSAQNVAYTRGSLYFADVDAKIRRASGGQRKLDDVILPLFERRRREGRLDQQTLVDAFVKELGPSARDEFQAVIIRGETINPDASAFSPCFERRPKKFSAAGTEVDGFEWVRVLSIPDDRCREW